MFCHHYANNIFGLGLDDDEQEEVDSLKNFSLEIVCLRRHRSPFPLPLPVPSYFIAKKLCAPFRILISFLQLIRNCYSREKEENKKMSKDVTELIQM